MGLLEFDKMIKLLDRYKIDYPKLKVSKSPEQAARFAREIGFPVVLKIISKDIIHKSDIGGVKVNVTSEPQVVAAYEEIIKSVRKKAPKSKVEGILVQKMEKGIEVIIGMKRDPQFDSVIMFGLGGIFVEILKDTSFRVAPIEKEQAEEMINDIKGIGILKGARGEKPANISALADLIVRVSRLAAENKRIIEIDLNPVIVNEKEVNVADVRMISE